MQILQGYEACALGAVKAGCSFYAGYPITPSTGIMEKIAVLLPERGGVFLQMEDEIGAMGAVIGSSWGGKKAMTATSGPGFSLMQEHIGYAAMTETPCVIVDAQRGGPSTGMPTLPSQGDVLQARWGSHGDRPAIVLTASSVRDVYEFTIESFNFAEKYRVPVVLLLDAMLANMRENVELPEIEIVDRARPANLETFEPFGSAQFLPVGSGKRIVVTGITHDETGKVLAADGAAGERLLRKAIDRIDSDLEHVLRYRTHMLDDAQYAIVAYGSTARAARASVDKLRDEGIRVGLLEMQTLWPFPKAVIADIASRVEGVLVPEVNLGQMIWFVEAAVAGQAQVEGLNRADGKLFRPDQIAVAVRKLAGVPEGPPAREHAHAAGSGEA